MKKSRLLGAVCACFTFSLAVSAQAATVFGTGGGSYTTAQNVNSGFGLGFNSDIGDSTGANTSTIIPNVSVNVTSDGGNDWFRFSVAETSSTTILDIDYGMNVGVSDDLEMGLFNSAGTLLAANDDVGIVAGAGGSVHSYDPFIQTLLNPGDYYVAICSYSCSFASPFTVSGATVAVGATYTLQISTGAVTPASVVPIPAAAWLFGSGLLGLVGIARRKKSA